MWTGLLGKFSACATALVSMIAAAATARRIVFKPNILARVLPLTCDAPRTASQQIVTLLT